MVFVKLYQTLKTTHIYGVEWDWDAGNSTAGTRTDDAVGLADPNPAVNNGNSFLGGHQYAQYQ